MACNGQLGDKETGLNRKLQIRTNLLGAYKAHKVYNSFLSTYTETAWTELNAKKKIAPAWQMTGTLDLAKEVFTITTKSPDNTVPDLAGGWAIFYNKTDLEAKVTANTLMDILDVTNTAVKISSSTATEITLAEALPSDYTDVYVMESAYYDLPLATDFTFSFSSNAIDVTDQYSGGATENIMGISTADISGITGNYSGDYHIVFQLRYMNLKKGCTIDVRHFASLKVDEPVFYQTVFPNEFSVAGMLNGSAQLTYAGNFLNASGYPIIKSIVTEGVIPDML